MYNSDNKNFGGSATEMIFTEEMEKLNQYTDKIRIIMESSQSVNFEYQFKLKCLDTLSSVLSDDENDKLSKTLIELNKAMNGRLYISGKNENMQSILYRIPVFSLIKSCIMSLTILDDKIYTVLNKNEDKKNPDITKNKTNKVKAYDIIENILKTSMMKLIEEGRQMLIPQQYLSLRKEINKRLKQIQTQKLKYGGNA